MCIYDIYGSAQCSNPKYYNMYAFAIYIVEID